MVDRSKLHALLEWMFQSVGNDLLSLVVVDREGLVLDSLMVKGIDEELIGGIAALVEPVLKRIAKEFDSGNFGTGSFDTEKFRLIFCEAGPEAVLVMIADLLASLDAIFPYAYLCAEKVARIFDNRPVSPVIPDFDNIGAPLIGSENVAQILIKEGSYILKTVLVGDGGVGKTTLVQQFVHEKFDNDYKSTIGLSIMKKVVPFKQWNVEVRMSIFDLGGQSQFKKVRKTYFLGAKAGIMVYDVTRPETFENITEWYNECKESNPDMLIMLVANKIDLIDERKITEEQGKAFARKLNVAYFETSALNKDIVEEAFRTISFLFIRPLNLQKLI